VDQIARIDFTLTIGGNQEMMELPASAVLLNSGEQHDKRRGGKSPGGGPGAQRPRSDRTGGRWSPPIQHITVRIEFQNLSSAVVKRVKFRYYD
jgi:hypothetical protein